MSILKLPIQEVLYLSKHCPVFDVRSPSEYKHAHIPHAKSLPIFSDQQRAEIGTAYKQKSIQDAIKIGLSHFGKDLTHYIQTVEKELATVEDKKIIVHCWRGGMRSSAMAWLLDFYGFDVVLLEGGYKSYRNHVLSNLALPLQYTILGGYTGSGKTEVLLELKNRGEAVIDLEGLASHKGSAFGAIGMQEQPSQEQFENNLYQELSNYYSISQEGAITQEKTIWIENESQRIGLINIPKQLFNHIIQAKLFVLNISFEERLKYILTQYGNLDKEKLKEAVLRIQKKLGGLDTKNVINDLAEGNIQAAFDVLLKYYDRQYLISANRNKREGVHVYSDSINATLNADLLLSKNGDDRRI